MEKYFLYTVFSEITKIYSKNESNILELYLCLFRIILLSYKPLGTKISIKNNLITLQEPSILQGIIRNISGDTREDIHKLHNPIKYILSKSDKNNEQDVFFLNKFNDGIKNLCRNYHVNSLINYTLKFYMNMIDEFLFTGQNNYDNNILLNNLNMWNQEEINIFFSILKLIEKNKNFMDNYILSLENILISKEKIFLNCIENNGI